MPLCCLPKAFLAAAQGFNIIADSFELDCHWVPLATTRRFLAANRELVKKIATIYIESVRLFTSDPKATLKEIGRWLPALEKKPQVLEQCYKIFAERFEPTLRPSLPSIDSILHEVALQDPRAAHIKAVSLVEELT
jgi:ABC-type nitrate/sulfonate/bicarbonate transport system substrate-binding protein